MDRRAAPAHATPRASPWTGAADARAPRMRSSGLPGAHVATGRAWSAGAGAAVVLAVVLGALFAAAIPAKATAREGDDVTIYRCTDAAGRVSIGNVPCPGDAREEVRNMVRPQDAPSRPAAPPSPGESDPPPPAVVVQQVVVPPPQALYECVRPDGTVYESDSGQGEVRWRPLWTSAWPVGGWRADGRGRHGRPPGGGDRGARGATTRAGDGLSVPPVSRISIPPDPPRPDPRIGPRPGPRPPHGGWAPAEPGTWERDPCHVLPQAEACSRLRDRRVEVRRRIFNAQQRERDALRVEERGLSARLDRDCGAT